MNNPILTVDLTIDGKDPGWTVMFSPHKNVFRCWKCKRFCHPRFGMQYDRDLNPMDDTYSNCCIEPAYVTLVWDYVKKKYKKPAC